MKIKITRRTGSRQKGYTLFEIMLVLGIIAVLAGGAIYKLLPLLGSAQVDQVESDIKSISIALRTYEMNNLRKPTTEQGLKALVQMPTADPKPKKWRQLMDEVPVDPWGMEYVYRNPGKFNPSGYDLYSLGPDRKESDDDIGKKK